MTQKEIISIIKGSVQEPPERCVDVCLDNLPDVRRRPYLQRLLALELRSFSGLFYAGVVVFASLEFFIWQALSPDQALRTAALFSAVILLFPAGQLMAQGEGDMDELERTSLYSRGQHLMAKAMCFFLLSIVESGITFSMAAVYCPQGAGAAVSTLIPGLCGSAAALWEARLLSRRKGPMLVTFVAAALAGSFFQGRIAGKGLLAEGVSAAALFILILIQFPTFLAGGAYDEAYSI